MMETVLSDFPLDEGIAVPVANAENKQLEAELDSKQKEILSNKDKVGDHKERIDAINDHLKNVLQELQHTQELLNARKREIDTEDHLKQIAEREEGRLRNEMRRIQNDLNELDSRRNIAENNIFMKTKQLEELKSQMNWDQKALEAWLEESAKRDEDALILEKYTRSDESKVKSLSLKTEKMTEESQKKRRDLENEINRSATAQVELDKTAEEFRKIHAERQNLLEQWENTIEQMQKRDRDMDQLAVRLAEFRLEVRSKEDLIKDRQNFLDNELNNNAEKEKKVSNSEKQSAKLRLQYQEVENDRVRFQDELETLKYSVDRTGKDLNNAREKCNTLKKEVKTRQEKLSDVQNERDMLNQKLKETIESTMTAEERAFAMEQLLKEEEVRIHQVEKELARLREIQFRKTEELHSCKVKEQNTSAEIQGSRAASRNLSCKLHKLDQDSLKQQEILYMQDFQLQQLERKLMRMQGERSSEEKQLLEEKIKELSSQLDEQNSVHALLTAQMKKLGDDLRREKRYLASGDEEKSGLTCKIEELNLHNDSSQRELKKMIKSKEEAMVDENILKLEIKRLREFLSGKADDVLSLEKRKLRLEASMNQRRQEIKDHKDMLRAQIKSANEERQTVSAELHDRISKIEKLRKRYEILMVSMAPPEGEEEKSQAYYVIKAAQEKEELQRDGDELDAKIRKAEKEIRALENTLRLMSDRNENYRKSFNKVDQTSEEFEEKEKLEEQLRAVMEKYKFKRRQIREVQEDLETMNSSLNALAKDEQDLVELLKERQTKMAHLENELNDQTAKQERTRKHNSRIVRDIRSAKKVKGETHEERDIELRGIRDFNTDIMKQIGVVVQTHGDMSAATQLYFNQAGLPAPPSPSRLGSRPSSVQSSRSSSLASNRSVSSVQSGESHRSVGSVNISLDLDEKPAVGTSRSGIAGSSVTKIKSSSSRRGSKAGSPAGSKPGSHSGSQPGSPAGSKPGSRSGSQPGSPAGSKPGSRQGSARTGRRS